MELPLVLLPGALGSVEGSEALAGLLGEDRRLVVIDYRAEDRFGPLLERIITAAAAPRFDLLGQSYGGWIAQCLAARTPGSVRRLVLAHSFALEPRHRQRFRIGHRLLAGLPRGLLKPLLAARAAKALAPVRARDAALFDRQLAELRRGLDSGPLFDILLAQQICMAESLEGVEGTPASPPDKPVLIIESDDDPLLPASARKALRNRFPGAAVHCFAGAGHVSALVETERFARLVGDFLDAPDP